MIHLIEKELKLNINKFFYILPILTSALMMIPIWIYVIVFMYFFWITVPNIYGSYNAQRDLTFTQMLPVSKRNIVTSKIITLTIIELIHIILGVVFAIIHNQVYGSFNIFIDMNIAFFGLIFIMFALFTIIFFPLFFKTAYHYGKALIISSIAVTLYAAGIELLNFYVPTFNLWIESREYALLQIGILAIGIILYVISIYISIKISVKSFVDEV